MSPLWFWELREWACEGVTLKSCAAAVAGFLSLGAITMVAESSTWRPERVDMLKRCFEAGLTCSEIAREIGVTRNAVIGKLSRLGLSRPREVIAKPLRRAAALARPRIPRSRRLRYVSADILAQREMLKTAFAAAELHVDEEPVVPIDNGRGCTLLELGERKCRWPISDPGSNDFCFCGNEPVSGFPYCAGHARMAYRRAGARRQHY
ncbi:MAG TPA: GcrA family cell cycle regulator [Xanthobacteraceae bacterium]|jgi:GcrA cell cycle regulator